MSGGTDEGVLGSAPESRVVDEGRRWIRHTHPYGFRSGSWGEILTTLPAPDGTDCYMVRFPDGVTDLWRVTDEAEPYEFSTSLPEEDA